MALTYIIDPLAIATEGFVTTSSNNIKNALTIATQGFIVLLEEEIIEVPITQGGHAAAIIHDPYKNIKKKKRITATVTIDNINYSQSIEVDDITVELSNVEVIITDKVKPEIKLTIKR